MGLLPTSLWHDTLPADERARPPRPALPGDRTVDVVVVGAGYTGLWTALSLAEHDPTLRITVLERETAGFGASGRNGGWCSALLPMSWDRVAAEAGGDRTAAVRLQRAMNDTVVEVGRVAEREAIDCGYHRGGWLCLARTPVQAARLRDEVAHSHEWGFDEHVWLDRAEARQRIGAENVLGATFVPHCAVLQPAVLARGLARAVERRGVVVHEQTPVTAIEPGAARTPYGTVRAEVVVRATEAFTAGLPGHRRTLAPVYSLMVATEPLPASFWAEVGWHGREALNDARRLVIYGQRTADDRIAFGGRGAPYHWASQIAPRFDRDDRVHDALRRTLDELFPSLDGARISHRWGGPLGIARDWFAGVGFDRATGLAWAGGYVGDGVAASNLAGRTLADLVLGRHSDLVELAWVGHRSRRWEPEPLRWLGINTMLRLVAGADVSEQRYGRPTRWQRFFLDRFLGD